MKKLFVILFAIVLGFTLSGCSKESEVTEEIYTHTSCIVDGDTYTSNRFYEVDGITKIDKLHVTVIVYDDYIKIHWFNQFGIDFIYEDIIIYDDSNTSWYCVNNYESDWD